jgi:hypothetical protein
MGEVVMGVVVAVFIVAGSALVGWTAAVLVQVTKGPAHDLSK